jgi:CheY-like chemotaxis protein
VSSRCRKVLVVDDEDDIRDIISDILVENSFEVEMASSALEALDKLKHGDFDLLLTDIEMPGIKGHELIRKVVDEFNPAPKMIIISAGISYLSKEIKDLVQGELAKPFSEKDLLNVVDSVWKL